MHDKAVYAGTFDPMTLGHLDLVQRACRVFDRIIIAVVKNSRKKTMFHLDQRVEMVRQSVQEMEAVEVDTFDGLLVDYARTRDVQVLVRGIRAYSDFEAEFQMALTNRKLAPEVETLFLMPNEGYSYVSSSIVREVAELGGDTSEFVPAAVQRFLNKIRDDR